jgi:hypothetical protein
MNVLVIIHNGGHGDFTSNYGDLTVVMEILNMSVPHLQSKKEKKII